MTGNEIRKKFLQYFETKGHTIVDGSPLIPRDDPTLLFTNAGMVQFKRIFTGEEKRGYGRAATCQRCVRAGGKHNDLENVGHTARHHTFFEMLGNFSFGDYFKEDAIRYAWEFLTAVLCLPKEHLWVSVFEEDDEAYALWEKIEDLPKGHIVRLGEKDNFWAMGDTGPCGPCSEIHYDQGPSVGCGRPECKVGCELDCDRFLELWNLVFMQFNRDEAGKMTPLPKPSIDTGMGLERIAAVLQGKHTNYDSDIFAGLIGKIADLAGKPYGKSEQNDTAMRVIADHCRATTFLVADGILPANEGRGYVLRRIMRRAVRFGRSLGLNRPFLVDITAEVVKEMSAAYPQLTEAGDLLAKVVPNEEERFSETLDNGLHMLNREIERLLQPTTDDKSAKKISGDFTFKLYDTYGFPLDIVRDVAMEHGLAVDEEGYAAAMARQRRLSKKSWKTTGLAALSDGVRALLAEGHKTRFVGYDNRRWTSVIGALLDENGKTVSTADQSAKISIFCPETPFYAEAGGQIGDHGEVIGPRGKARVKDTVTIENGLVLHEAEILEGALSCGDKVSMKVEEGRRQKIANNHTATHLLQAALKSVLGDHVKQSGSLVTPRRLRFDFTHFSAMTAGEIATVETLVNEEIRADSPIHTDHRSRAAAIKAGATALFGEKYGDTVRVVAIGSVSKELCGGTHVERTGEIGLLKILTENGIAAGVRRIEAITGPTAFKLFQRSDECLNKMAVLFKTNPDELPDKIKKTLARQKELEKEISRLTARLSLADLDGMIDNAKMFGDIKVLAAQIPLDAPKTLREVGDRVRDRLNTGVAVLGGIFAGKAALLVIVSKDLTKRFHAGKIINVIAAKVGGKGGGRPDMAQAGGPMVDKLPEALAAVHEIMAEQLAAANPPK